MTNFAMSLLILINTSSPAFAATCETKLKACDEALTAADGAIKAQSLLIDNLNAENQTLNRTLQAALEERAEAKVWYKQPSVVGPLAFVLGVVVGIKAAK